MRLILIVAAALTLGGCNMVYSVKPLFSASDAAGGPGFRPGLWSQAKADCAFDETQPRAAWPQCADKTIITPTQLRDADDASKTMDYVLVGGSPQVLQVPFTGDDKADKAKTPPVYFYVAVQPVKTDAKGRLTAARTWLSLCGPPPAKTPDLVKKDGSRNSYGTEHPLPGLKMDAKGDNCEATTQAAVRNSAKASEAWDTDHNLIHWVRDGTD